MCKHSLKDSEEKGNFSLSLLQKTVRGGQLLKIQRLLSTSKLICILIHFEVMGDKRNSVENFIAF